MLMSGLIIRVFLMFHLLHFTVRALLGHEYKQAIVAGDGSEYPVEVRLIKKGKTIVDSYGEVVHTHNIHDMMIAGLWITF